MTHAFTCTGPYAVLIATGIKTVENRSMMPEPSKGRCAISCSKSFNEAEYGRFVEWASRELSTDDFKLIPSWADVCDWPGKIIGACDYEARRGDERTQWNEGYEYWWDLSNVTVFDQPVECRGNIGMWEMPLELAVKVSSADEIAQACEKPIRTMEDAALIFRLAMPIVGGVEGFFVLPLDEEHKPICAPVLVSMGTESNTTAVSVADVFREVFKVGAESFIVAHNHPGGTLKPSADDIVLTQELTRAAKLLGIKLLDHLILGHHTFASIIN